MLGVTQNLSAASFIVSTALKLSAEKLECSKRNEHKLIMRRHTQAALHKVLKEREENDFFIRGGKNSNRTIQVL